MKDHSNHKRFTLRGAVGPMAGFWGWTLGFSVLNAGTQRANWLNGRLHLSEP
jgi:hypothetical protein